MRGRRNPRPICSSMIRTAFLLCAGGKFLLFFDVHGASNPTGHENGVASGFHDHPASVGLDPMMGSFLAPRPLPQHEIFFQPLARARPHSTLQTRSRSSPHSSAPHSRSTTSAPFLREGTTSSIASRGEEQVPRVSSDITNVISSIAKPGALALRRRRALRPRSTPAPAAGPRRRRPVNSILSLDAGYDSEDDGMTSDIEAIRSSIIRRPSIAKRRPLPPPALPGAISTPPHSSDAENSEAEALNSTRVQLHTGGPIPSEDNGLLNTGGEERSHGDATAGGHTGEQGQQVPLRSEVDVLHVGREQSKEAPASSTASRITTQCPLSSELDVDDTNIFCRGTTPSTRTGTGTQSSCLAERALLDPMLSLLEGDGVASLTFCEDPDPVVKQSEVEEAQAHQKWRATGTRTQGDE